jgi:hypothetical protein
VAQEFSVDVSCFDIIVMLSRPFKSIDELAELLWLRTAKASLATVLLTAAGR